nr:MAG TPA: hypothetical protein [Caudoviricetes sp.]DAW36430.1 MAG TPA: hypothetical protein [Caudoviricetes sp.]
MKPLRSLPIRMLFLLTYRNIKFVLLDISSIYNEDVS